MVELRQRSQMDAVLELLEGTGVEAPGAPITELRQLEGGWSRHTYLLERGKGAPALVVRVRPSGGVVDADIESEYRIYRLLERGPLPIPRAHGFVGSEDTPFGGPFFVMDRVEGESPNIWRRGDREGLAADWTGDQAIASHFAECLATIHSLDPDPFADVVPARSFHALLDHWQGVQQATELVRDPVIEEAYVWAREREPEPVAPALVHGDYRIGNTLIAGRRIAAILDWELAFVGDPRFDLSYMALPYHSGKFVKPGSDLLSGVAEHDWFYDRYRRLSGRDVDREAVRTFTVIGGLMLFAIFVTGIRAYERGTTTDVRLPWGRFALPGLRQDLASLMDW